MKKSSFLVMFGFVAVVFQPVLSAMAGPPREIEINNAGFEAPVYAEGAYGPADGWTLGYYSLPDTTTWEPEEFAENESHGGFNPSAAEGYGGIAPEGKNVAYTSSFAGYDAGLSQVLSATLEANSQYELSVLVGNPAPYNGGPTADYRIELLAGGVLLASETGPSPVDDATWTTASLSYNSAANPEQLGQPLEIRLLAVDFTDWYEVHYDSVTLTRESLVPLPLAYGPEPSEGEMIEATAQLLMWKPGDLAVSHNVYFGETFDDVNQATPEDAAFMGNQSELLFVAQSLTAGATYYWRIDEVNDVHPDSPWKGDVWSFLVRPTEASNPWPVDGMRNVDPNQDLSWDVGMGSIFHTVYFSKNYDEVKNGTVLGMSEASPSHDPGPLDLDTTYYWRVDEFAYPANETYPGPVWSFTTRDEGGGVKAEYFDGMGLAGDPVLSQIEPVIDHQWGSGEVAGELADLVSARWRANVEAPFTETYKLITTSDDGVRLWLDGRLVIDNWTDHGTTDNSATVDLVAGQFYMIQMEYYENGGGAVAQLSWQSDTLPRQIIPQGWLQLPLRATSPSPAHLKPHADQAGMLTWNAGDDATAHNVYFGADADAVANADTTTTGIYRGQQAADATSFNPGGLEWGKTYYWRIDEVNPDGVLPGALWSFTAADFVVVDDFEGYTDDNLEYEAIFQTWIDGFGYTEPEDVMGNGTGSTVGYISPPFAEQTIVHSGYTSMPLDYNNVNAPWYSEAERTWTVGQNWTVNGVDTLTLYFRGRPSNGPDDLYVALQDTAGRVAAVPNPNPDAVLATDWTEWRIPLADFAGVNTAGIKKMYIGMGNRNNPMPGGAGLIYIDDIRVTKAASSE